jgi:hypothetical protein
LLAYPHDIFAASDRQQINCVLGHCSPARS